MGYIIKDTQGLVITRLTDVGRRKIAQGNFNVNNTIRAVTTNANYVIASFDATPLKLVKITVEPDPIDAEPEDDYGYSTTIEEYPNIASDE